MSVKGRNFYERHLRLANAWRVAVNAGDPVRARLTRIAFYRLVDHVMCSKDRAH